MPKNKMLLLVQLVVNLAVAMNAHICKDEICKYEFNVEYVETMVYNDGTKTYNVGSFGHGLKIIENSYTKFDDAIGRDVNSSDVITADGYHRTVISINKQFPGPTIEVMEGAQIVVKVKNKLFTDAFSIHWHGLDQRGTPWMDGDAHITQCPILPGTSFTYRFLAEPAGTHMYHNHYGNLQYNGIFGAIIIHKRQPMYEYFIANIFDWYHFDAHEIYTMNPWAPHHSGSATTLVNGEDRDFLFDNNEASPMKFVSALVNGRGRYNDSELLPLETFDVSTGVTYRFHVLHNGFEQFFIVSIDSHKINLVAADSGEIKPMLVDFVILGPGERIVFEVTANQNPEKYWFRVQTLRDGAGMNPTPDGLYQGAKAIIRYNKIIGQDDPVSQPIECTTSSPCTVYNCPFPAYPIDRNRNCISVDKAESTLSEDYMRDHFGLNEDEDIVELFYNFGYHIGSSINGRKLLHPSVPVYTPNIDKYHVKCEPEQCNSGCVCTNIQTLPPGKTVQLVVSNLQESAWMGHHLIHLHGHNFAVIHSGFPDYNATTGAWTSPNTDVICNNDVCSAPRWNGMSPNMNLQNPPIRDTFTLPSRGYAVIRFRTDNPGFWPFHCHQLSHFLEGMGMYFNEAQESQPPVPNDFPTCGNFEMSDDKFIEYINGDYQTSSTTEIPMVEMTTKPRVIVDDRDDKGIMGGGIVTMPVGTAAGIGIALVILGCILSVMPLLVYICCVKERGSSKKNGHATF